MIRFDEFQAETPDFWFRQRFISEQLGYTSKERQAKNRRLMTYTPAMIIDLFAAKGYKISELEAVKQSRYSVLRANAADVARDNLMQADEARDLYEKVAARAKKMGVSWDDLGINIPMNKQKGAKKNVSFLTALVDLLTYFAVKDYAITVDYDPHSLMRLSDSSRILRGVSSRRFDGAIPSVSDPRIIWEIKEYYYTTTFGSRISDGVYETRLDGYEIGQFQEISRNKPVHVLFTDSYSVWWEQGKSYLCRLIDMLNEGSVDKIYFGREVLNWEKDLHDLLA